ncbi:MAG: peptidase dimerization domain-containing protein, partial [Planctomycetota bacterium]|nr:peptidase dimerization domain-containing protein [Planctomycetota bacterium]
GGAKLPATLYFVSTADEEIGATGAKRLAAEGFRVDAAVVGEPTDLAIIHAHKGASRLRITTRGRAAHSSDPSAGVNAIARMARIVEAIEGPMAAGLAARPHPVLGPPTVSVGRIRGGTQVNVVPDRCEIDVDRRTLPGETSAGVVAEFRALLDGLRAGDPHLAYDIEESQWWPAFEEDPRGPAPGKRAMRLNRPGAISRLRVSAPHAERIEARSSAIAPSPNVGPAGAAPAGFTLGQATSRERSSAAAAMVTEDSMALAPARILSCATGCLPTRGYRILISIWRTFSRRVGRPAAHDDNTIR